MSNSAAAEPVRKDVVALIDEVIRLSGRLASARKMTTRIAGMLPAHWLVLTAICRAPRAPTVARIARSFGHSRQAIQRIANHLEQQGLVTFHDNPADRRARTLAPTTEGERAFALADREGDRWAADLASGLDAVAIGTAARLLATLRQRLESQARSPVRTDRQGERR
ncbi:MarR family winged helix-turn-helix transcriptional regulator [Flavisphingomonas formosensis]|uniref:MarR family winged helix-turn-helix transcriptional regulator n=1 Tax=Flavisphingomonas formosensis TaxID=861534 RepID=UPI0018DF426B|nr:MarR family transcriptional regulator [Sphingomonas formosensis]